MAAIPNWLDVKFKDDNIRSFMAEWERARKAYAEGLPVLNLGVNYKFEGSTQQDKVDVGNGVMLDFTNTSSGLQSLIPLYVHLDYITKKLPLNDKEESISQRNMNQEFLQIMYKELYEDKSFSVFIGDDAYREFRDKYNQYIYTDHCDIFIEEPENNLFPPTQSLLTEWLLDLSNGKNDYGCNMFIATHSPYLLTSILEKEIQDFALLIVISENCESSVIKTASEEDISDIYDKGVDAFFNISSFV